MALAFFNSLGELIQFVQVNCELDSNSERERKKEKNIHDFPWIFIFFPFRSLHKFLEKVEISNSASAVIYTCLPHFWRCLTFTFVVVKVKGLLGSNFYTFSLNYSRPHLISASKVPLRPSAVWLQPLPRSRRRPAMDSVGATSLHGKTHTIKCWQL